MEPLVFYTTAEVAELLRLNPQVVMRKLKAGEIPAYRVGREWRVERGQLLQWLERHSNQRAQTPKQRTLDAFFDTDGRLKSIPVKSSKRAFVLERLVEAFEPDRAYTERELNAVLRRFHDDVASIRREMVTSRLLIRTKDGVYKRVTSAASAALRRA